MGNRSIAAVQLLRQCGCRTSGIFFLTSPGVELLYNCVAAGLDSGQLARVVLELLGLEPRFLSLFPSGVLARSGR